jgi:NitT/TauT family transport system permease protein
MTQISPNVLESPESSDPSARRPSVDRRAPSRSSAVAVCAPSAAALAALLAHELLPDAQSLSIAWTDAPPAWLHPYPLLLAGALVLSFIAAGAQFAWRRWRRALDHYGPLLAGAIALVCLWDLATLKFAWLPLPYFPGPDMVLAGMIDDRVILLDSTYRSLTLLLSGYSVGVAAGLTSGVLMGWFRRARYWGMPVLKVLGPIPATAFVPLAMVLFSNSFFAGAALIGLAVWFPVTMLTTSGIANVPASYFDVARTLGAGRGYLIFRVAVPAALPSVFIGLFMGLGSSFLTLIVAETLGVKSGLGWYLKWQQGYAEYAHVYAAIVIMAVFFSSLMTLLFKVRDWVLGWQKGLIRW